VSIRDYDSFDFRKYTIKGEVDKAIHTLEGLIKGIAIDGHINKSEIEELESWFNLNQLLLERHPFSELTQILKDSLADDYFSDDEKADILWMCSQYSSQSLFYNLLTSDIQRLHGILHGILADNVIELREMEMLDEWLADNDHLTGLYPYDELCSLITVVLRDGRLTPEEIDLLKAFFSEFIDTRQSYNLNEFELKELRQESRISGICVMCPQLVIPDKLYCFTGVSSKAKRTDIKKIIEDKGGKFKNSIVKDTDYLIVGNGGNPCWAFSCYGRKVEQAVNLRKAGQSILIVHENDFWDEIRV
jgi:NAD-dependent DNA ligase